MLPYWIRYFRKNISTLLFISLLSTNAMGEQQLLLRNNTNVFQLYTVDGVSVDDNVSSGLSGVTIDSSWTIQSFADLNGDGSNDILMRNVNGGWTGYLVKDGDVIESGEIAITTNADWKFRAAQDFDGNGTADVLLRNESNGSWFLYLLDGFNIPASGSINLAFNQDWKFQGAADFNGDGRGDVLLRHQSNNSWYLYALDGIEIDQSDTGLIRFALNPSWEFAAADDFTGDGKADMIMRREDGPWWMYQTDGTEVLQNSNFGLLALTGNTTWEYKGSGDMNGDGKRDILLRNVDDGRWFVYALDGRSKIDSSTGQISLTSDLSWKYEGLGGTIDYSWIAEKFNGKYTGVMKSSVAVFGVDSTDVEFEISGEHITFTQNHFFGETCIFSGTLAGKSTKVTALGSYKCSDFTSGTWTAVRIEKTSREAFIADLEVVSPEGTYSAKYIGMFEQYWDQVRSQEQLGYYYQNSNSYMALAGEYDGSMLREGSCFDSWPYDYEIYGSDTEIEFSSNTIEITQTSFSSGTCIFTGSVSESQQIPLSSSGTFMCSNFDEGTWSSQYIVSTGPYSFFAELNVDIPDKECSYVVKYNGLK